jgi:predicted amidophosphoribosyltransferase
VWLTVMGDGINPSGDEEGWIATIPESATLYLLALGGLVVAIPTAFLWRRDRRRYPPGHCRQCGYNLTGNESGICSECRVHYQEMLRTATPSIPGMVRKARKHIDVGFPQCQTCGYNLTGNESGICPECGEPVESTP